MTQPDADHVDLPATARAVLGILSFGEEMTGYDVKRWADQSLAYFYWAPSHSQIYAELRRLEKLGLATSRIQNTHEAKSRRLYAITAAGMAAMAAWSDAPVLEPVILKNPLVMRLWAAHNGDRSRLLDLFAAHRDDARTRAERAAAHGRRAAEVESWRFAALSSEWSARFWAEEADRIEWMRQRLEEQLRAEGGSA